MVTVHYTYVGQCDAIFNVTVGGQPVPDQDGVAYLFIRILKIENNRPDAVDFELTNSKMFINQGDSRPTFDLVGVVQSPSPFHVPPGTVQNGLFLLYSAQVSGLDANNPAQDAANVNWFVEYDSTGLPDGQGVLMVKEPPQAGGQVQRDCSLLQFPR
jgi:hypothetical protein